MYIEPNSKFILLKGCPLDNTYTHTIWFKDKTAQYNYFYSLKKHELPKQSYQRYKRGVMRVEVSTDSLYDCNYLMFQNTAYGDKWFYAFILGVEYINNKTSEITYQIDVMQTWYFDYTIKHCFVEREHSQKDVIGENIVPENLETGDFIIVEDGVIKETSELGIVVSATIDSQYNDTSGGMFTGVYSGTNLLYFDDLTLVQQPDGSFKEEHGYVGLTHFLSNIGGKAEAIQSMCYAPKAFNLGKGSNSAVEIDKVFDKEYDSINGYTPKNKKLFTAPYNYFELSNQQGTTIPYYYELFQTNPQSENPNGITFKMYGDTSATPSVTVVPQFYGKAGDNLDEKIVLQSMPQVAWTSDTYKAWYAQNQNSLFAQQATGVLGGALAFIGGVASENPALAIGGAVSVVSSVGGVLAKKADVSKKADRANSQSSSNGLLSLKKFGIYYCKKQIRYQFAKIIDKYFDLYGYATHLLKVPNIADTDYGFPRPYWCYTKTIGAEIVGAMPTDDLKTVISIYDKGITFWKNGENVGDYSLDNSV